MDKMVDIISFIWGIPLTLVIVLVGIYFSINIKFIQITKIKQVIKNTIGKIKEKNSKNTIVTVLGGTIGAGNVAGVASAIAVGGPGAIFWMWVIALFSMATKMVEVVLAVRFQKKDSNGNNYGGPMYYMNKIKGNVGKILSVVYSIALLIYVLCDAGFVQINTVASSLTETFPIQNWIIGVVLLVLSIIVVSGGLKRVTDVLTKIVPGMCIFYLIAALIVIIANITNIPSSIVTIVKYAFSPAPVVGGFVGATVVQAISKGASRGIFANEAGIGTSTTVHATTENKPFVQGLWGILEVGIVSFVVCTITALLVMSTGAWKTGLDGAPMVLNAFESLYGTFGKYVLCIVIVCFSYSTYIGFFYEFTTCIKYFIKEKYYKYAKWLYIVPAVLAVFLPINVIWTMADLSVGFAIIPNLIALILLRNEFKEIFKSGSKLIGVK